MKKALMTLTFVAACGGAVYALGGALVFSHSPVPATPPAALKMPVPAPAAAKSAPAPQAPAAEEPEAEDIGGCG